MTALSTQARMQADPSDPRHGTLNGYSNLRCRCQPCRDVWSVYCLGRRRQRGEPPEHGTDNGYTNYACRCRPCTDEHTRLTVASSRRRKAAAARP